MVIWEDYNLVGMHNGAIYSECGELQIVGHHNGSLHVPNAKSKISGKQNGSTHIANRAVINVTGSVNGSGHLKPNGELLIVSVKATAP